MHILYTDESEVYPPGASHPQYFILSGVSVYESQTYQLSRKLNDIAARFNPRDAESVELHGSPMFSRKKLWRNHSQEDRIQAIKDALQVLAKSNRNNRIFAVVVEKNAVLSPMAYAFEQLAYLFDDYLERETRHRSHAQRGMILFDKSAHEERIQSATTVYWNEGHQRGALKYFAEVPAFIDSKSSRLIQLADMVAYAINRKMAYNDEQFYQIIQSRFYSYEGKTHGLHIKTGVNGG